MNPDLMPLVWGHGPKKLELFLEPTCPFSAKAYAKLEALVERAGPQRLTVAVRLQSQPWHLASPVLTRAVLAASLLPDASAAARVLACALNERAVFEPEDHCSGALLAQSPQQILSSLQEKTGLDLAQAFANPAVTTLMKWQARYARQNGIHATPSFMVDGLVVADMSSGDEIEVWLGKLGMA